MLMHLGYGIGSFIVPLYVNPFLAEVKQQINVNLTQMLGNLSTAAHIRSTTVSSLGPTTTTEKEYYPETSRIEYAYIISSIYAVIISLFFYVNQTREPRGMVKHVSGTGKENGQQTKPFKEIINPASCANGNFWYGTQIMSLMFMYFANVGGGNIMTQVFLRTFCVDQLHLTTNQSTLLNTCYWIGFSFGRLATALASRWLSVRALIITHSSGIAVCSILMSIFSDDNALSFWILSISFAFFTATIWPTGIAWTDYHIELTGIGMTLQILGASLGGIVHLRLIGYIYEHYGPITYLYQTLAYSIFQLLISCILNIIGSRNGGRFKNMNIEEKL